MVPDDDQVAGKALVRDHVAVLVCDPIDHRPLFGLELAFVEEAIDTDVVVAGEHEDRDPFPDSGKDARHLVIFLPGQGRDAVLDIPKKDQVIRLCCINDRHEPLEPGDASTLEMHTMRRKISLDPEMEVGNNEVAFLSLNNKRRALFKKFKIHSGLTNPFWGW